MGKLRCNATNLRFFLIFLLVSVNLRLHLFECHVEMQVIIHLTLIPMCQYALSTGICHDKINTYWFQCQYINTPLNFQIIYVFGQSFSTYFNLMYRYLIHVDNFFLFYKRLLKLFFKVFLSQKSLENFKSYTFTCNISKSC